MPHSTTIDEWLRCLGGYALAEGTGQRTVEHYRTKRQQPQNQKTKT
jgi:hypothetical protein